MSYVDKLERHQRLMSRMFSRNGADVDLAEHVGLVSPEDVFEATLACTGCTSPGDCEAHLDAGAPDLPGYCRNGETIRRLSAEMADLGLSDP